MKLPRTFVLTVDRKIKLFDDTESHLESMGLEWERFDGLDNQICRLTPVDTFDVDRVGEKIAPKHVAACLSHYILWRCMSMQPDESFIVYEYDVRLVPDWREQFDRAMSVMPDDWDVVFLGSACCAGRPTTHIAENVYEVLWPLAGHAMLFRRKALPVLLKEHQRIWAPLDIALFYGALPKLRTYTIIDPIAVQHGTHLPP